MIALSRPLRVAAVLAAPSLLPAQQPEPPRGRPTVLAGYVADSLRGGSLAGAVVLVEGTQRRGETDADGMFRIDSVPPGAWRLALLHPVLDSLGLSVTTQPIPFGRDSVFHVDLSTPSAGVLAASWCAPAARRMGPGALLGRVVDAESSEGVLGARTSLVYEEVETLGAIQVRRIPRVRTAATDSAGRFALCGLPETMRGTLQVERPGSRTPEVPVTLGETGYAVRIVLLASTTVAAQPGAAGPGAPAQRLRGSAGVRGRITTPDARPVAGARVTVEGTGAETTTDATGAYSIGELPPGTWTVLARRVGARPEQRVVSLPPLRVTEVSLVLQPVTELEAVVVRDTVQRGLQRVGFESRRRGGMGHYITPEQIEQQRPLQTTDVLRTLPGILVSSDGRGRSVIRSTRDGGRGCVAIYVDGMQQLDGGVELDAQVPASEVAAVEVYSSGTAPPEFTPPGRGTCGAVVLWTKTRTRSRAVK